MCEAYHTRGGVAVKSLFYPIEANFKNISYADSHRLN